MLPGPETSSGFEPRTFTDEEIAEFIREDELDDEALAMVRRIEQMIERADKAFAESDPTSNSQRRHRSASRAGSR